MDDELRQAWQSQTSPRRLTLDAELVLNEVRRNERQFAAMIYCRDLREVGVALVLIPVWFYLGFKQSLPWSWYVVVPGLIWIAAFMLIDRHRQRPHQSQPGDSLRTSVEKSLAQVEHQIWLLRNVLWWYLLPIVIAVAGFMGAEFWEVELMTRQAAPNGPHPTPAGETGLIVIRAVGFGSVLLGFAVVIILYRWIYRLNQSAVRRKLEPRRDELQSLLASLNLDDE